MTAPGARRVLRLAHRGDWRGAPENSLAALLTAVRMPHVEGVEFDVRGSRDGVPVVIHDDDLARVQGIAARVRDLTAAELALHQVPTLADVVAALPRRAFLDVELKEDLGARVVEVLAGGRGAELENAVISSFEDDVLGRVARLAPGWPRWLNSERLDPATVQRALDLGCRGIAAEWHAITARSALLAAGAGLGLAAWTVQRRATARRLVALGVVAICVEGAALSE